MRTLYIDCGMGAAGDMLTASLIELLPDREAFVERLNNMGIPGVTYILEPSVKCGITGSHMRVVVDGVEEGDDHHHEHHHDYDDHDHHHDHDHDHHHDHGDHDHDHGPHHHHSSMHSIEHIVKNHMNVSDKVRADILAVYSLIAEAESQVHGVPVTDIHFHEVGTKDAIADVAAVSMLMEELNPDEVIASPVHVGSGQVECAHGILPVPAPATALILNNIPIYSGNIRGELCTPTGAALLKHFVTRFGDMPIMKLEKIGYGMGKKDFEAANCVRTMIGETESGSDMIIELSCNVDDMTGEDIGFAMEKLMEGGARDVFTTPIGMKKSRPGILLSVMCSPDKKEDIIELIFRHTTTIGVREKTYQRHILDRKEETIETSYGSVRVKTSTGYGVTRKKLEYEDLARIAKEEDLSIEEVRDKIWTNYMKN